MEPKQYQLFIDGKNFLTRGLDLACNPFNGNVLGEVVLVAESLISSDPQEDEDTVWIINDRPMSA